MISPLEKYQRVYDLTGLHMTIVTQVQGPRGDRKRFIVEAHLYDHKHGVEGHEIDCVPIQTWRARRRG